MAALYELHHDAALRLAQALAGADGADDLLSEAFACVVARFRAGAGPSSNFRGYLFTAIRNRHRDLRCRSGHEEPVSHEPWRLDQPVLPAAEPSEAFQVEHAAAALATLPEAWQRVLWLVEVEGLCVGEVAERLQLNPAAVSSLAYRAREGLRTAYLEQRVSLAPPTTSECAWVRERLAGYVRAALSSRAAFRVASHLGQCVVCATLSEDLHRVNRCFRSCRRPAPRYPSAAAPSVDASRSATASVAAS